MENSQNKAAVRRLYNEVINGGNLDLADELIHENATENENLEGGAQGREGFKDFYRMFRHSFPDYNFVIEDMIAEGDSVVVRLTIKGTHQNEFMGIASTGNKIEFGSIDILRFEDGLIVEHWGQSDMLCMLGQLNAMPAIGS